MNSKLPRTAFALAAIFALMGQTAPSTMPQNHDAEIARLRAENAELRKQLAAAKTKPAETAPTTAPKTFTTMQDILVNAPADLRPQAKPEWYKYTESKFETWWEEQLVGITFQQTMTLGSKSVHQPIIRTPGVEWIAELGFESKSFTYFGADHRWSVSIPALHTDEAGAKKWDTVKIGTLFKLKGTLSKINISQTQYIHDKLPAYRLLMTLRDVEISPPN